MTTAQAQLYNNGTTILINQGGIVSVKGTDVINEGVVDHHGYLMVDSSIHNHNDWLSDSTNISTVVLGQDWVNNDLFSSGKGEFDFIGNNQWLTGDKGSDFYTLKLNGPALAVKSLGADISVQNTLGLNKAELACRDHIALLDSQSKEIVRSSGFVSTWYEGRLIRDFSTRKSLPSLFPLGYNAKGKIIYKPIVVDETKSGTFRTAFIYQDATDFGLDISIMDDSLCTVNDEFFHIIGSDIANTAKFSIVTDQREEWTKLADWREDTWNKVSRSGETEVDREIAFGAQSYYTHSDRAVALATERPFVETVEKILYVPYNSSVQLKPNYYVKGNTTYSWSPPDYLDCDNCPTPWYSTGFPETYTIEVDNGVGCLASDTIRVEIVRGENNPTLIPNAFSPNGDLLNEVFRPHLYPFEELIRLRIYNRWGGLIYDGTDGWDGTYMGKESPMGAYLYMAEIKELKPGGRYQPNYFKGTVNLIK